MLSWCKARFWVLGGMAVYALGVYLLWRGR